MNNRERDDENNDQTAHCQYSYENGSLRKSMSANWCELPTQQSLLILSASHLWLTFMVPSRCSAMHSSMGFWIAHYTRINANCDKPAISWDFMGEGEGGEKKTKPLPPPCRWCTCGEVWAPTSEGGDTEITFRSLLVNSPWRLSV